MKGRFLKVLNAVEVQNKPKQYFPGVKQQARASEIAGITAATRKTAQSVWAESQCTTSSNDLSVPTREMEPLKGQVPHKRKGVLRVEMQLFCLRF